MEEPNINFTVEHNNLFFLQNIFIGDYGKYNSPLLPVYIISGPELSVDGYKEEKAHSNFLIVESCKDSDLGYREIAYILMRYQSDDEIYVAFKGLWEGENRWDQVEKLAKAILWFVYDRGYKIISVFPFNLIPLEMYFPKQKSKLLENSSDKVPPPMGILGTEKEADQSDLEGSESVNPMIYVPKIVESDLSDLLRKIPDPSGKIKKYGRNRDHTENDIRLIVDRCRWFMRTGTIAAFYDFLPIHIQDKFELETLRAYLKDPIFKPK